MSPFIPLGTRRRRAVRALVLVAALLGPTCLTTPADAYLYWTNPELGTLERANLAGGEVDERFIAGASRPNGVAVGAKYVYWANEASGTIGRANLEGGEVNESFIAGIKGVDEVALNGKYLYWASGLKNTIGRSNLEGGEVNKSLIAGEGNVVALAVHGNYIYWSSEPGLWIARANLEGGEVKRRFIYRMEELEGPFGPLALTVHGKHIYWCDPDFGSIGRANLDGKHVTRRFIGGIVGPVGVATFGKYIYWVNNIDSEIGRADLDGADANQHLISDRSTGGPLHIAANGALPPWTLTLTSFPSSSVGVPLTIEAVTNNPLGESSYRINVFSRSKSGTWLPLTTCTTTVCDGSFSPPPPYPASGEVAADVGPAGARPFSKRTVVSKTLKVTAAYTPPHCEGSECM